MTQSLAALVEATCGALDRMAVRITGAWQPGASLSGGWTRHAWHGVASAAAPMVALLCARTGGVVAWHKSDRSKAQAQAAMPIHEMEIRLAVTVAPDSPLLGLDAQVQRAQANVTTRDLAAEPAAAARALDIPAERAATTGIAIDLATVHGTPEVAFSVLFIAGSQVKMGRNHLWHVRPALAPALGEPLRTILSRGRRGALALDAPGLRS
jgi:hypothetical protein